MGFSLQEGWGRGPCYAEHTAALCPGHVDTCGSHCLRTELVHHRWCMDMCPSLCLCQNQAKGPLPEPGGKGPQSGDTSPIHTGPILSHSHWMDSALKIKTTDREQPTRPPAIVPGTHAREQGWGWGSAGGHPRGRLQDLACSDKRAE